jgi:hypothetical protein
MKFVDKLLGLLKKGFSLIADTLGNIVDFLAKPLSYLFWFLDGIFYFITKLFAVVVAIIKIFVAIFQFLFALIAGLFRTIVKWLSVNPNPNDVSFPSVSNSGFKAVMDVIQPTGLLTVVPLICICVVWFGFIIKMIGLFGGEIYINVGGRSKE